MGSDQDDAGLEQAWLRYVAAREGLLARRAREQQHGVDETGPRGRTIDLRDAVPMTRSGH